MNFTWYDYYERQGVEQATLQQAVGQATFDRQAMQQAFFDRQAMARAILERQATERAILDRQAMEQKVLAELNQTLTRMEGEMTALKFRLNAMEFRHLPPEMLSEVFIAYVVNPPIQDLALVKEPPPYWWLTLLHICRYWRQVAQSTPQLWTTVATTRPEVVTTMLKRSGRLPLTIQLNACTRNLRKPAVVDLYKPVLNQSSRIRHASFLLTDEVLKLLSSETPLNAPLLESLEVSVALRRDVTTFPAFTLMILPLLSTLTIHNVTPEIVRALVRPTLTSLTLTRHLIRPIEKLADVLSDLPALRELAVESLGQSPWDPGEPIDSLPPSSPLISLPQLTYLRMDDQGCGASNARLLDYLLIPDNAELQFIAEDYCFGSMRARIFSSIREKLKTASGSVIRPQSLYISIPSGPGSLCISLWTNRQTREDLAWPKSHHSRKLTLNISIEDDVETARRIMSDFFNGIDLVDVMTMHVSNLPITTNAWIRGFSAMNNLEELALCGTAFNRGFMLGSVHRSPADDFTRYMFPSLKVLELYRVKMKKCLDRKSHNDHLDCLVDMLAWRMVLCPPLERLILVAPVGMSDKDYDALVHHRGVEVFERIRLLYPSKRKYTHDEDETSDDESEEETSGEDGSQAEESEEESEG